MEELEACRLLISQADDLRHENPARAVRMAEATRDLVAALDHEKVGMPDWLALQADAWAVWGSSLRAVAELRQAESALNVALEFLKTPDLLPHRDPLALPRLGQRAAGLRCDQRRFDEALALIDEAIDAYESCGERQWAVRALVDRGLILGNRGDRREALACLGHALDRLDPTASPRNFLAAVHNTAFYLYELSAGPETDRLALAWLQLARRCHAAMPESLNLLKLRGIEALTLIRLGRVDEGIRELWCVQEGYRRCGAAYEQAIALLHLAAFYLNNGRPDEVKRVAGQLFPFFRSRDVDREASAALMLFYDAAHADAATLDLIAEVTETLREVQLRRSQEPLRSS